MYLNLRIKRAETFKVVADYNAKELLIEVDYQNIEASDFFDNCASDLKEYKKLNINLDEILKSTPFPKILPEILFLTFKSIYSKYSFIPFSFKKNAFNSIEEYKNSSILEKRSKNEEYDWKISCSKNYPEILNLMEAIEFAKQLQEIPPNLLKPEDFIKLAQEIMDGMDESSKKLFNIKIYDSSYIEKNNLNLISSVASGSKNNSKLLVIEYLPKPGEVPKAIIGKGVCYDSGGLNVKTGNYMSNMKFDMSGAATTLAVTYALIKNNSKENLISLMPLVENLISEKSYKADDVIISHSGISVEIENTDAEGRLILADSLSYAAKKYNPSELISIATLTGSIGYALGSKYSGAWSTSEENWIKLSKAANISGEFIWRMPFHEYYLKKLKNTRVADLKNSAKTGRGGASRAACFLKEFTNNLPYIHLDIANTAYAECTQEAKAPLIKTLYYYLYR